jgi:toxin ParE1/3/4
MVPIRWLRNALGNVQSIHAYYIDEGSQKTARVVCQLIVKTVNQLKEFPNLGRIGRVSGTRELVVPKTPYLVIYREVSLNRREARGATREVQILRILHSSQKWPIC